MLLENNKQKNEIVSQNIKDIKKAKSSNNLFPNQNNNFPFLSRKDTMYLSVINSNDFPLRKFKQLSSERNWSLNLYNLDIEGSSPKKFGLFTKKIDYTNKNRDIEKSYPIEHYKKIVPNYSLSNKDIEGTTPKLIKIKINRCTNPLNPNYNLPKTEMNSLDLTKDYKIDKNYKFIRDTLNIDDIEGTKPKKFCNIFLRNTLNKDDIKETFPKQRYVRKDKYNNIDYSDIKKIKHGRNKAVNPLNPFYNWNYSINNVKYRVGPIDKNEPHPFSVYKYKTPFNNNNDDIEGSKAGTKNRYKNFKGSNSCLNIGDIKGAIHGSLLKGISTKRCLNPLIPNYRYLGEEELKTLGKNEFHSNNNTIDNKISRVSSFILINTSTSPTNNELIKSNEKKKYILKNPDLSKTPNKPNIDEKINKILSDLHENPLDNKETYFDKNLYKKPEIYFPLKHDKSINFINKDERHKNKNNKNLNFRDFQHLIDSKFKSFYKVNNKPDFSVENRPFESQMDDFLDNHFINFNNRQKNISSFKTIGIQDELKTNNIFSSI